MFVFSIKNDNNDPTRDSFDKYYMQLVEIKDFNAVKSKQDMYEKLSELWKKDDYATGNLLDFSHS